MAQAMRQETYDVVVLGGGAAGIAAAVGAAKHGARTLIVDAGPMIGGELVSGIPLDGCLSSRGEWVVGGAVRELLAECDKLGGYIGPIRDYRSLTIVCYDTEIMKIAVVNWVRRHKIDLLLYTFAHDVVVSDGRVTGLVVLNKNQRTLLKAKLFIDCSGDGDLAIGAGAPFEVGDAAKGELQPVTLVFRMQGVDAPKLLQFVRDHPENFGLGEYAGLNLTKAQCAEALQKQGLPKVFIVAEGPVLGAAIASGEMYKTSMIGATPISLARKEVSVNTTRIGHLDATRTDKLSQALPDLMEQVWKCATFLQKRVPGFDQAVYSGVAPRIGIRETRRVMGEYVLNDDDVKEARKRPDGIAKGAHEYDIHLAGTGHIRHAIKDGGSYDIPYGTLVPKGLKNVLVAGRCMSATRGAHSTARVMGTVMAMGEAAGTAAAMCATANAWGGDVREVQVPRLRDVLKAQGAVLDGTH
ncbi:MAG: FAD-dependent oxidoreductase [Alphaproteobacteria bacterium]|nr:FAD-dependent oxidoreductase [Alphaproteobacteria bacterium]